MKAGGKGFRETQHRVWDMGQRLDYMMETVITSPPTSILSFQVERTFSFIIPLNLHNN